MLNNTGSGNAGNALNNIFLLKSNINVTIIPTKMPTWHNKIKIIPTLDVCPTNKA